MTDRDRIVGYLFAVAEPFDIEAEEYAGSIRIADRRIYFNEKGEVWKVLDYKTKKRTVDQEEADRLGRGRGKGRKSKESKHAIP